ncbi:FAD/NAD(P)-binding protein [Candidatus Poribacteria bacterium]|nr:FAD/NAD(P)-binding protein [Candidatus Poribacteria bacterium]
MDYSLKYQHILNEDKLLKTKSHLRKTDLENFEKTFKSEITGVISLTSQEKLFQIQIINHEERERFLFNPGQFLMLEVPGLGEIPISISSSPSRRGVVELCIRKTGRVTNFLHQMQRGSIVGLKGPFGTNFPMEKMSNSDILLIAGGLGLAALRSSIYFVEENRNMFKNIYIMYGTNTPDQMLFTYQYETWKKIDGIKLLTIVQNPDKTWKGRTGLITKLLDEVSIDASNTYAIVCGPPIMFKFVCNRLNEIGLPMRKMFVSLERRMHCGMGKCCRCNVGSTYTCLTGPVFDYWTVINLKEAI